MRAFLRQLVYLAVYGTLGVLLTLAVSIGVHFANRPVLMPWHMAPLAAEFRAAVAANFKSLDDYCALESKLMAQLDTEVYAQVPQGQHRAVNRYFAGSHADARKHTPNWNLTFEMPVSQSKGAALLLHGLTDSPYSMRALAELFAKRGWYVVGLRLPGHGTAPSALTRVTWQDRAATTRLAARYLRAKTGPSVPLDFLCGCRTSMRSSCKSGRTGNPENGKKKANHAGSTSFVLPELVVGSLREGFERIRTLRAI
jgi:hypothetical protein